MNAISSSSVITLSGMFFGFGMMMFSTFGLMIIAMLLHFPRRRLKGIGHSIYPAGMMVLALIYICRVG